jgi:hypothetical protein
MEAERLVSEAKKKKIEGLYFYLFYLFIFILFSWSSESLLPATRMAGKMQED